MTLEDNAPILKPEVLFQEAVLVYLSPVEWFALRQRPHHLAEQMAYTFSNVYYVQPSGLRCIKLRDFNRVKGWLQHKIFSKNTNLDQQVGPCNLSLVAPWFIPFNGYRSIDRLNSIILKNTLDSLIHRELKIYLWVSAPFPYLPHLLSTMKNKITLVYDQIDDYRLFHPNADHLFDIESQLLKQADMVFTSSIKLKSRAREIRHKKALFLLPNGADIKHWRGHDTDKAYPLKINTNNLPVIGYFGCVSDWLDENLIFEIALRKHQWQFVFIGPIIRPEIITRIHSLKNIHFFGEIAYSRLPSIARNFDVCWIPFKDNSLTHTINPVKVYEYLAMGKQVLAPAFPDLAVLKPCVVTAKGVCQYINRLESMLESKDNLDIINSCIALAENFSWDNLWRKATLQLSKIP